MNLSDRESLQSKSAAGSRFINAESTKHTTEVHLTGFLFYDGVHLIFAKIPVGAKRYGDNMT